MTATQRHLDPEHLNRIKAKFDESSDWLSDSMAIEITTQGIKKSFFLARLYSKEREFEKQTMIFIRLLQEQLALSFDADNPSLMCRHNKYSKLHIHKLFDAMLKNGYDEKMKIARKTFINIDTPEQWMIDLFVDFRMYRRNKKVKKGYELMDMQPPEKFFKGMSSEGFDVDDDL